ncbi:MAG: 23S rRNA (guanosine(2251)-2'-O)-methyltransferase RlmB [Ardenticatenaceae bacterium]|nr:23S rRNA (guanosine(2251)-2'-O)-methyltransferase RlmB [Ardenticatenaceae bacterium]
MSEFLIRRNPVLEALRGRRRPLYRLWVQKDGPSKLLRPILQQAHQVNIEVREVGKQKLGNLCQSGDHQGVVLEAGGYRYAEISDMLALAESKNEQPFILIFDLVQGTYNVGTLLRSADVCGVHGVIMQTRRAPDINPTIVQHSQGATEHLHIAQVTNLSQAIGELKGQDIWVAGLDIDEGGYSWGEIDLNRPLALVVGHEGEGLRRRVREQCDFIFRLPMKGHVDSLNAAVAGSVALYAAWQARQFA